MTTREELNEIRHKLNNPKLALFETTKLQRRLGELLRQVEQEETDGQLQQQVTQTEKQ